MKIDHIWIDSYVEPGKGFCQCGWPYKEYIDFKTYEWKVIPPGTTYRRTKEEWNRHLNEN